jgi:hypothetical protein
MFHLVKYKASMRSVNPSDWLTLCCFKRATIGDLVECFEIVRPEIKASWQPKGGVFTIRPPPLFNLLILSYLI